MKTKYLKKNINLVKLNILNDKPKMFVINL